MTIKKICVFCASSPNLSQDYLDSARHLGNTIAEKGFSLVYGGGKCGLMGEVAKGALEKDGYVLGVTPSFLEYDNVVFYDCSKLIRTETMRERKKIMEEEADAFIIMPGGIGTFEELYEVLTLKQLKRHMKPIIIYNYNNFYKTTYDMIKDAIEKHFISKDVLKLFTVAKNEEDIFKQLEEYVPFSYDKFEY